MVEVVTVLANLVIKVIDFTLAITVIVINQVRVLFILFILMMMVFMMVIIMVIVVVTMMAMLATMKFILSMSIKVVPIAIIMILIKDA